MHHWPQLMNYPESLTQCSKRFHLKTKIRHRPPFQTTERNLSPVPCPAHYSHQVAAVVTATAPNLYIKAHPACDLWTHPKFRGSRILHFLHLDRRAFHTSPTAPNCLHREIPLQVMTGAHVFQPVTWREVFLLFHLLLHLHLGLHPDLHQIRTLPLTC